MSRNVLGIDLQETGLEAVVVKSGLRETRLLGASTVPLPGGPGGEGALREALEKLLSLPAAREADCAISLPADWFFLRTVTVPFSSPKKIRLVLPYELEPDLPLPAEALAFSFAPIGPAGDAGRTRVLAAAIEKRRLEAVTAALAAVGLEPARLTLSGFALALWAAQSGELPPRFFHLQVESRFAALYLVEEGRIRLARSFPLPGAESEREAAILRQFRLTAGMLGEAEEEGNGPAAVLLAGSGGATLDAARLAQSLSRSVRGIDVRAASGIAAEGETDPRSWDPFRRNGALALALAEIENLHSLSLGRGGLPGRQILTRHRGHLLRTAALAAAALVLGIGQAAVETTLLDRRAAALDARMAAVFREAFPEARATVDPYRQMRAGLQEIKKSALSASGAGSPRSIDLLRRLSEAVPAEIPVVIERLVLGPEGLLVTGTTAGFQEVETIKDRLERTAGFKSVAIGSANLDRGGKEVNFQLKVDL
ncbi:MAG: type II secretion system protein GspL [Desulfobacterales bacterium]